MPTHSLKHIGASCALLLIAVPAFSDPPAQSLSDVIQLIHAGGPPPAEHSAQWEAVKPLVLANLDRPIVTEEWIAPIKKLLTFYGFEEIFSVSWGGPGSGSGAGPEHTYAKLIVFRLIHSESYQFPTVHPSQWIKTYEVLRKTFQTQHQHIHRYSRDALWYTLFFPWLSEKEVHEMEEVLSAGVHQLGYTIGQRMLEKILVLHPHIWPRTLVFARTIFEHLSYHHNYHLLRERDPANLHASSRAWNAYLCYLMWHVPESLHYLGDEISTRLMLATVFDLHSSQEQQVLDILKGLRQHEKLPSTILYTLSRLLNSAAPANIKKEAAWALYYSSTVWPHEVWNDVLKHLNNECHGQNPDLDHMLRVHWALFAKQRFWNAELQAWITQIASSNLSQHISIQKMLVQHKTLLEQQQKGKVWQKITAFIGSCRQRH